MDLFREGGGGRGGEIPLGRFTLQKLEISTMLLGHLVLMQTVGQTKHKLPILVFHHNLLRVL